MATRYATIDVGTNTVKLTIAEKDAGGLAAVLDTSRPTRLGEGMHLGRLREVAIRRTVDAMEEFITLCRIHHVQELSAVGTAALREATNRDDFLARAREKGVDVQVIPGEEEARLSYQAVRRDPLWRDLKNLLVIDIGGGSTEIIQGGARDASPRHRISLKLGAVKLTEKALYSDPPTIQQMAQADELAGHVLEQLDLPDLSFAAVGVGGTFVNMASVKEGLEQRNPDHIHGSRLTISDVEAEVAMFAEKSVEQRKQIIGLDPARADIILGGAILLLHVMQHARLESVTVSVRGLRWGVMYDRFGDRLS